MREPTADFAAVEKRNSDRPRAQNAGTTNRQIFICLKKVFIYSNICYSIKEAMINLRHNLTDKNESVHHHIFLLCPIFPSVTYNIFLFPCAISHLFLIYHISCSLILDRISFHQHTTSYQVVSFKYRCDTVHYCSSPHRPVRSIPEYSNLQQLFYAPLKISRRENKKG